MLVIAIRDCFVENAFRSPGDPAFEYGGAPNDNLRPADGKPWPDGIVPVPVTSVQPKKGDRPPMAGPAPKPGKRSPRTSADPPDAAVFG